MVGCGTERGNMERTDTACRQLERRHTTSNNLEQRNPIKRNVDTTTACIGNLVIGRTIRKEPGKVAHEKQSANIIAGWKA